MGQASYISRLLAVHWRGGLRHLTEVPPDEV